MADHAAKTTARMFDFLHRRTPWHRRLWAPGTVLGLHEVVEYSRVRREANLPPDGLKFVASTMRREITLDPGSIPFVAQLDPILERGERMDPNAENQLEHLAHRVDDGYLDRWTVALAGGQPPSVERTARSVTAHLLDKGFSSDHLYRWLDADRHHNAAPDVARVLGEATVAATVDGASHAYQYDAGGTRTRVDGEPQLWDAVTTGIPTLVDDGEHTYLHAGSGLLAIDDQQVLADALGSVRATADESGVDDTLDYTAYGEPRGTPLAGFGFTGQTHDEDTGLIHLRARQYNPSLGAFLSPDPVQPNTAGTDGWNKSAYASGNPLTGTDPLGTSTGTLPSSTIPVGEASIDLESIFSFLDNYRYSTFREPDVADGVNRARAGSFQQPRANTRLSSNGGVLLEYLGVLAAGTFGTMVLSGLTQPIAYGPVDIMGQTLATPVEQLARLTPDHISVISLSPMTVQFPDPETGIRRTEVWSPCDVRSPFGVSGLIATSFAAWTILNFRGVNPFDAEVEKVDFAWKQTVAVVSVCETSSGVVVGFAGGQPALSPAQVNLASKGGLFVVQGGGDHAERRVVRAAAGNASGPTGYRPLAITVTNLFCGPKSLDCNTWMTSNAGAIVLSPNVYKNGNPYKGSRLAVWPAFTRWSRDCGRC